MSFINKEEEEEEITFKQWGRHQRERALNRLCIWHNTSSSFNTKRVCYLWTAFPQIPLCVPFSHVVCLSCKNYFTPDSLVSLCPLYLHVQCGKCMYECLDRKCPCFIEIELILRGLIGNKDVAAKITYLSLDYQ